MAEQMRSLHIVEEYNLSVFHGRTSSLSALATFLESYLAGTAPIGAPSITAFVLPPASDRERSFQFFKQLGASLRAMGIDEYAEIYAFDDGAMPSYELRQMPGRPVPFWGLQDVTSIDLPPGAGHDDILRICRQRCRSNHFVLIDDYKDISETFLLWAAMSAEADRDRIQGYRLYNTSG